MGSDGLVLLSSWGRGTAQSCGLPHSLRSPVGAGPPKAAQTAKAALLAWLGCPFNAWVYSAGPRGSLSVHVACVSNKGTCTLHIPLFGGGGGEVL